MPGICSNCGLPKELCVCEEIAKEERVIEISMERRRYGKKITLISGIGKDANPRKVLKKLKKKLACGGTYKNDKLELQGDHRTLVKEALIDEGFPADSVLIK